MTRDSAQTLELVVAAAGREASRRDYLYDDPESFRAGVQEGVRAMLKLLVVRPSVARVETA